MPCRRWKKSAEPEKARFFAAKTALFLKAAGLRFIGTCGNNIR